MGLDLNLDGGEISIIKAIGVSGGVVTGEEIMDKLQGTTAAELIDTLKGLVMQGFIEMDRRSLYNEDDLKVTHFNVNSGYSRDLKEAMNPQPTKRSRRVRRE